MSAFGTYQTNGISHADVRLWHKADMPMSGHDVRL